MMQLCIPGIGSVW